MNALFRCRVPKKTLSDAERIALSMGMDLGAVVRSCLAELVRRGELPWQPGQVTHVRMAVPSDLPKDAKTVEVAVPVALIRQALENEKAPGDAAEGQDD